MLIFRPVLCALSGADLEHGVQRHEMWSRSAPDFSVRWAPVERSPGRFRMVASSASCTCRWCWPGGQARPAGVIAPDTVSGPRCGAHGARQSDPLAGCGIQPVAAAAAPAGLEPERCPRRDYPRMELGLTWTDAGGDWSLDAPSPTAPLASPRLDREQPCSSPQPRGPGRGGVSSPGCSGTTRASTRPAWSSIRCSARCMSPAVALNSGRPRLPNPRARSACRRS